MRNKVLRNKYLVWQNVTEGWLTDELKSAAIIFLCEVKKWRLLRGRPFPVYGTYSPRALNKMAISWDRRQFKVVAKGYRMFHWNGKREGWPGIPTPNRGVIFIIGYWRGDRQKKLYCYWETWFLNSWLPMGHHDAWTNDRYRIVNKRSIPVVEDLIADVLRNRNVKGALGGGDTNSIKWDGDLEDMRPVHNRGLDRVWEAGDIDAKYVGETPRTGVGGQMYHEGIKVRQTI